MRTVSTYQPVPRHPGCFQNCSTVASWGHMEGMGKSLGKTLPIVPQKLWLQVPWS